MSIEEKKKLKEIERNSQLFTFIYESCYDEQSKIKNVLQSDAVSLEDVLSDFDMFLRGAGFNFKGSLGIIDNE